MAFDATKKKVGQPGAPTDPYSSLLEPAQTPGTDSTPLQGSGGPSSTGYVNFGDYYNANAGAAAAGAQQLQTSAAQKGQNAQAELGKAQSAFTGAVSAGTPQGPTGADYQRASTHTGVNAPPTVDVTTAGANLGHGQVTAPQGSTAATTPESDAQWKARMQAGYDKANAGYTGPNALSDTANYDKLLNDTTAAQDESTALASGNNGIAGALQGSANTAADAALLGAAGRSGFVGLGQKYGGLVNSLNSADAASQKQSDAAKRQGLQAQNAYGLLGDVYSKTQSEDAAANAAAANAPAADPWNDADQQAYQAALAKGSEQALNNGWNVYTNQGAKNADGSSDGGTSGQGWGFFQGANGGPGERIGINDQQNADGSPDTSGWWGGAGGPAVGDASIPAAVWYALAAMTPEQRAAWWQHNHPGGS